MSEIENPAEAAEAAAPAAEADLAASAAPEVEAADPADPAVPAEVEVADDEADEDEIDAEPEILLNADGHPAFAGELFGGPDAGQANHFVESEGITLPEDEEDAPEGEV